MKVRYNDLTVDERKHICNGCGGKGGWINPPEFKFHASCNHHDFNYWLGCTEDDRLKADKQFYTAMKKDADRLPWYRRYSHKVLAFTYYRAVRRFGKSFFYYGDKQKDRNDLYKEIQLKKYRMER